MWPLAYAFHINISLKQKYHNKFHNIANSSPGWDEIPTFIAKQCVHGVIKQLTLLINQSFSQGVFPDELKLAWVIPVYNANDKA